MSKEKVLTLRGKKAVWAPAPAGVGGSGAFIVTATTTDGSTYTADKTFADTLAAFKAGQVVQFRTLVEGTTSVYNLIRAMDDSMVFELHAFVNDNNFVSVVQSTFASDESISLAFAQIQLGY